jgi:outer membrane lipoprotein-sorting protein
VTHRLFVAMGLCLAIALTLSAGTAAAQGKKAAPKLTRVEGNVQSIEAATKMVTVRLRGKTNTVPVLFSDKTLFTFRNKAGSVDQVKDGRHVICLGTYNDKQQLVASRIDVRDEK